MEGKLLQIPRERDKCFLYMPNPSIIHPRSIKIEHHLKLLDFYIHMECPEKFVLEPKLGEYEPDVYMIDSFNRHCCVEIQITPITNKKMQTKIDQFVKEYKKNHMAKIMYLVTDNEYSKIKMPSDFKLVKIPMVKEPYA